MPLLKLSLAAVLLCAFAGFSQAAETPKYDMAPFKAIADETLKLVASKDYPAAEKKIIELEDKFDEGTKKLKTADRKVWTVIDKQMDVAIEAVKAAKDDAGGAKATKEINTFIAKLADADKVK